MSYLKEPIIISRCPQCGEHLALGITHYCSTSAIPAWMKICPMQTQKERHERAG
jgi:hypothetical protein